MKNILNKLFNYQSLEKGEAREILINLASGYYNSSQMAAFMTVYMMRNITVDELSGFRDAMLELCVKIPAGYIMLSIFVGREEMVRILSIFPLWLHL